MVKNPPGDEDTADMGLIPRSERSPGSPFHYSSLENFMDRGAWRAIVRGAAKSTMGLQMSCEYLHPSRFDKEMISGCLLPRCEGQVCVCAYVCFWVNSSCLLLWMSTSALAREWKIMAEVFIIVKKFVSQSISLSLVVKSCPTLSTLWTVACQAPLSLGFSRQE